MKPVQFNGCANFTQTPVQQIPSKDSPDADYLPDFPELASAQNQRKPLMFCQWPEELDIPILQNLPAVHS